MIYLLDTTILLAFLREPNPVQQFVDKHYAPLGSGNEAIISIVTLGEIKAIALRNKWGKHKIDKIEETLSTIIIADINNEEVINRYA